MDWSACTYGRGYAGTLVHFYVGMLVYRWMDDWIVRSIVRKTH